jgi:hypothetical protein
VGWTLTVHPENPKTPAVIKTNAKTTTAFGFIQTSFQPKKGTLVLKQLADLTY